MAGLDIAQGILAGLSGLAQVLNKGAEQRQTQDLEAAKLLTSTGDYTFTPATTVKPPGIAGAIFGTPPTGVGGHPLITIGNRQFILQPYGTINERLGTGKSSLPAGLSGVTTPGAPPDLRLTPEALVPEPAVQYPKPSAALTSQTTRPIQLPDHLQKILQNYNKLSPEIQDQIDTYVTAYAKQYRVPIAAAYAVMARESAFDPSAVSEFGAKGLMQVMSGTGQDMVGTQANLFDIGTNIQAGIKYLGQQLSAFPTLAKALSAYKNGPDSPQTTADALSKGSQSYIQDVLALNNYFSQILSGEPTAHAAEPQAPSALGFAGPGATAPPATVSPSPSSPPPALPPQRSLGAPVAQPAVLPSPPPAIATSGQGQPPVAAPAVPVTTIPVAEPPHTPAQQLTAKAVEKARQSPGQVIVDTSYGPMLLSLVPQLEKNIHDAGTLYRNNPKGRIAYKESIREASKDLVAQTERFVAYRDATAKAHPYATTQLRQARNWGELNAMAESIDPGAVQQHMYARVMNVASRAGDQKQLIAQAIAQYAALGMTDAMQKRVEADSGYAGWVKTQEKRQLGDIDFLQAQRKATDPTIRRGEVEKATAIARAQEAERPYGTDAFKQAADDVLARAKSEGTLPPTATIKDLTLTMRENAHLIEIQRQGLIKQATANILLDTPILRKEDLTGYMNPLTGQRARIGMSPRVIANSGMIPLPQKAQSTLDLRLEAKQHLKNQRLLAFGGTDTDGIVNGIPGEIIHGFLSDKAPEGIVSRAGETVSMRLKALGQQERGRLVTVFDRNQQGFAPIMGRGIGADAGHFTENDRLFATGMTGITGLRGMTLTDARKTIETQFRILDATLDNAMTRAIGDPASLAWHGMPPPLGTIPAEQSPGAKAKGTPSDATPQTAKEEAQKLFDKYAPQVGATP